MAKHRRSEPSAPGRGCTGIRRYGAVFAHVHQLVAHSVRAQHAAPIFLRVPASGARGLAAFAEPRGPLRRSGLVSCV